MKLPLAGAVSTCAIAIISKSGQCLSVQLVIYMTLMRCPYE